MAIVKEMTGRNRAAQLAIVTLEKETAAPSSILIWRIPMDRGAWRATVHSVAKRGTTEATQGGPMVGVSTAL